MPTNLTGQTISSTFGQLLHVDGGIGASLRPICDGDGFVTSVQIADDAFKVANVHLFNNNIAAANGLTISVGSGQTVTIDSANITGGNISGVTISGIPSASFTGNVQTAPVAVTSSGGTLTLDCTSSNVFTTTLNENTTLVASNPTTGQTINVLLTQGSTARTVSWPASFKWPDGTAPSVTASANAVDLLVATFIGSNWYASLVKGFA